MAVFIYTARTRTGGKVEGVVEATDRRAALLQIERLGHVPVSVNEKNVEKVEGEKSRRWGLTWRFARSRRMSGRDMLTFTIEMSDLLASGMKLSNALNTLSRRKLNPDADAIIHALRDDIIQGASLSEALGRFKETFPPLYISMVRAGEASGALHEIMQRIVKHFERIQEVREKVIMALVYPCIVMFAGLATMIFAMVFVIPRFALIFKDLGSTLPLPTRIMIGISSGLIHYGIFIAIALVVLAVAFRRYIRTEPGRLWWHAWHLRLPLIRNIVTASAFAQFARTLGLLISNGVSVLNALGIVEQTMPNSIIAAELRNARERVTDGTTISGPLAAGKVFPGMLTDMLAIGEETGDMNGALAHIARRYESSLDRSIKIFTTVLEPILIVVIALLVGFVAISILLAVFDLTSGLNM